MLKLLCRLNYNHNTVAMKNDKIIAYLVIFLFVCATTPIMGITPPSLNSYKSINIARLVKKPTQHTRIQALFSGMPQRISVFAQKNPYTAAFITMILSGGSLYSGYRGSQWAYNWFKKPKKKTAPSPEIPGFPPRTSLSAQEFNPKSTPLPPAIPEQPVPAVDSPAEPPALFKPPTEAQVAQQIYKQFREDKDTQDTMEMFLAHNTEAFLEQLPKLVKSQYNHRHKQILQAKNSLDKKLNTLLSNARKTSGQGTSLTPILSTLKSSLIQETFKVLNAIEGFNQESTTTRLQQQIDSIDQATNDYVKAITQIESEIITLEKTYNTPAE